MSEQKLTAEQIEMLELLRTTTTGVESCRPMTGEPALPLNVKATIREVLAVRDATIARFKRKLNRRTRQRDKAWLAQVYDISRAYDQGHAHGLEEAARIAEVGLCVTIAAAIRALIPASAAVGRATAPSRPEPMSDTTETGRGASKPENGGHVIIAKLRRKLKRRTLQRDSWREIGWASARISRTDALEEAAHAVEAWGGRAPQLLAAAIRALIPASAARSHATAPSRPEPRLDTAEVGSGPRPQEDGALAVLNDALVKGLAEMASVAQSHATAPSRPEPMSGTAETGTGSIDPERWAFRLSRVRDLSEAIGVEKGSGSSDPENGGHGTIGRDGKPYRDAFGRTAPGGEN